MATNKTTKGTYIQSVEASLIYEYTHRANSIKSTRDGFIPYSLELIKLREVGLEEYKIGKFDSEANEHEMISIKDLEARDLKVISKFNSDDVINVKFSTKVKNRKETIKAIESSIEKNIKRMTERNTPEEDITKYINTINEKIESILNDSNKDWDNEISAKDLRGILYATGFTLTNYKGEDVTYMPYKRSSAKARTGNVLFINVELLEEMEAWSRMGLTINDDKVLDTASLMAYEALVTSSIKDTVKIDPKNILIVDDVESTFKTAVKEIVDINGELTSIFNPEGTISNSLFDGQGLLDSSYFTNGKGMMLLRQQFFKSCVFNTNVIQFMKDTFKEKYDTATITDMFGNKVKVKDIHMITTPSSLKVFKFSSLVGTDKEMYKHWKKSVKADKSLFGICKSESTSKRGNHLQQMSYQMINSLPASPEQILELASNEIKYINDIKDDTEKFVEHLALTATRNNSNQMMIDLYNHNNDIAKTDLFNQFRIGNISNYVKKMKTGKIRINGDYAVMVGNPFEMLLHSIGQLDTANLSSQTLKGATVHSTMFKTGTSLVGFRNPHTSANNIYACENVIHELITKYFNFTPNVVAVNVIENPILDFLSGADFDSDTVLLTDNKTLVEIASKNNAIVCINKISSIKNQYTMKPLDRARVDNNIHSSLIGKVVNTGQLCQSIMYDAISEGDLDKAKEAETLLEIINVFSTIAIDLAKKSFNIDIDGEYKRLSKLVKGMMKEKNGIELFPNFFIQKENRAYYHTPMDILISVLNSEVKRAEELGEKIEMFELVMPCDENGEKFEIAKANDKQEKEILEIVQNYSDNVNAFKSKVNATENDSEKDFFKNEVLMENDKLRALMAKRTVKPVTMYAILYHAFVTKTIEDNILQVLGALYYSSSKNLISSFSAKKVEDC